MVECWVYFNSKKPDAQGLLKPRALIPREEGVLQTIIHPTPEELKLEVLINRGHGFLTG